MYRICVWLVGWLVGYRWKGIRRYTLLGAAASLPMTVVLLLLRMHVARKHVQICASLLLLSPYSGVSDSDGVRCSLLLLSLFGRVQ